MPVILAKVLNCVSGLFILLILAIKFMKLWITQLWLPRTAPLGLIFTIFETKGAQISSPVHSTGVYDTPNPQSPHRGEINYLFLFLDKVYIHLRKWNVESFFGECFVYLFIHIEKYAPVISAFGPYPDNDIH